MTLFLRSSRRVLPSCLAALGLAALGGPAQAAGLGYRVTLPRGWQTVREVRPHPDGGHTDMMWTHPPNAFPVFRVEVDPRGRATAEAAPAMQAWFLGRKMPGFRLLAQRPRRVAGVSGSETAAEGVYGGRRVVLDMIYVIHAGRGYTITLMTPRGRDRADEATFTRLLGTLRWTN